MPDFLQAALAKQQVTAAEKRVALAEQQVESEGAGCAKAEDIDKKLGSEQLPNMCIEDLPETLQQVLHILL